MTVRFKDESAALECVQLMHGRFYAGERIVAIISDGKERFRISKNDDADSQKKRQDAYNKWLENEPDAK
jgi:HIV Tat-specific factor 1